MVRWLQDVPALRQAPADLGPAQLPRHEPTSAVARPAAPGRLLRTVRRGEVWLTETGGIVDVHHAERQDAVPDRREPAQPARPSGCSAWRRSTAGASSGCTSTTGVQPATANRFDAGLLRRDGTARPAFDTLVDRLNDRRASTSAGSPSRQMTDLGERRRQRLRSSRCTSAWAAVTRMSPQPRCGAGPTWSSCATRRPATSGCSPRPPGFESCAPAAGALFWVNDRPDLALAAEADGVHVGQDDMPVASARAEVGARPPGRAVHPLAGPARRRPGLRRPTSSASVRCGPRPPRRAGRPRASTTCATPPQVAGDRPWFAIGGIDLGNLAEVRRARERRRVVVVRAIRDAADPEAAARELRDRLG